jgi:hypothetical protein
LSFGCYRRRLRHQFSDDVRPNTSTESRADRGAPLQHSEHVQLVNHVDHFRTNLRSTTGEWMSASSNKECAHQGARRFSFYCIILFRWTLGMSKLRASSRHCSFTTAMKRCHEMESSSRWPVQAAADITGQRRAPHCSMRTAEAPSTLSETGRSHHAKRCSPDTRQHDLKSVWPKNCCLVGPAIGCCTLASML